MEYFETPEQVSQQLEEARKRLEQFADSAPTEQLLTRLTAAQPYHVTLVMRKVFVVGTGLSLALTGLIIAAPFVLEKSVVAWVSHVETAAFGGAPLPVVTLTCAFCMFIAWMMSTQAALAYARECPLLPFEKKEQERLLGEYTRLSGQKAIMERLRGTPMGSAARASTPVSQYGRPVTPAGVARVAGPDTTAPQRSNLIERALGAGGDLPPPDPGRITGPMRTRQSGAVSGARGTISGTVERNVKTSGPLSKVSGPVSSAAATRAAETTSGEVRIAVSGPVRRQKGATVDEIQPTTRAGVPLGAAPLSGASAIGRGKPRQPDGGWVDASASDPTRAGSPPTSGATPEPAYDRAAAPADTSAAFSVPDIVDSGNDFIVDDDRAAPTGTEFPRWGAVTEPWLEDAIQRAETLARTFPQQAHLEFSPQENLPFVLVLERATPAMAQRSMVAYVEFLAAIATPPRARIEFRSVATMDPAFYRSVTAALEPFFGEAAEVTRDSKTKRVEIDFLEPDVGWKDYPYLPIAT
jgi:hypothetical protein